MPKVSVILSNYNGERYLKESISSVLKQTYTDFEFIIVDDASTDSSREVINSYNDPRIKRYYAEKNRHIAYSLNRALEMVSGEYIARIDSDDIWEINKLELQVRYMDEHRECGACFTKVNIIDKYSAIANGIYEEYYRMFNDVENKSQIEWIRFFFYKGNCLCHPSVVMRKSVLENVGGYHLAYVPAEDYELWSRIVMHYPIFVMEEKLVRYRWEESENKISGKTNGRIYAFSNVIMLARKRILNLLGDEAFVDCFKEDFVNKTSSSPEELECEKAHILLRCSGNNMNFLGLEKYEQILGENHKLFILEEKMGFSLPEYYKEYRIKNFASSEELERTTLEIERLYSALEDKQKKIDYLQFLVDELMSSKSWKITSPLRKAMRILKRR